MHVNYQVNRCVSDLSYSLVTHSQNSRFQTATRLGGEHMSAILVLQHRDNRQGAHMKRYYLGPDNDYLSFSEVAVIALWALFVGAFWTLVVLVS